MIREPSGITVIPPPPDSSDAPKAKEAESSTNTRVVKRTAEHFRYKPKIPIEKTSVEEFLRN
jgi:hypothetical protein